MTKVRSTLSWLGIGLVIMILGSTIAGAILAVHYLGVVTAIPLCPSGNGWQASTDNTVSIGNVDVTGKDGRVVLRQTNHPENVQTFEVGPAAHKIEMSTRSSDGQVVPLGYAYFAMCGNKLMYNFSQYHPQPATSPALRTKEG